MSCWKAAAIDKCITDHLAVAGTLDDPKGDALVHELVREALEDKVIAAAASACMLSQTDFVIAYKAVVKELYPNIFLCIGTFPLLTASMPFTDPNSFPAFTASLTHGTDFDDEPEFRREMIAANAVNLCVELWRQGEIQGKTRPKEWAFERVKGRANLDIRQRAGCLKLLLIGVGGGVILLILLLIAR
ncbi:MAG TPA: hypothetical protein VEC99_16245 [Clostridia bacterium]|nr:hypothetical protein [Clostridia bacterium]